MMGVSTVVVTTNVSGRNDLFGKFIELLGDLNVPAPAPTIPNNSNDQQYRYYLVKERDIDGRESTQTKLLKEPRTADGGFTSPAGSVSVHPGAIALAEGVISISDVKQNESMRKWASIQLSQGSCLIVNNAAQSILKASNLVDTARGMCSRARVPPVQFMLTIDEADDFYRTDSGASDSIEREIKMEEKMRELKEIGPLCQLEVTATLLAIYMRLLRFDQASVPSGDIFYVEASQEYVDARMLVPPSDSNGTPLFITNESDLNNNNTYADHKVRAMWKEAAGHEPPPGGYGALLLDATTAAVRAGGRTIGIYDKAKLVMRLHPNAIVVVVSGAEIAWRAAQPRNDRPLDASNLGQLPNMFRGKLKIFTEILEEIDIYYPNRPVFVFGYSQLVRGISYRSRRRVPSHFVLLYKDGMPLCRLVQAAGRAMGEQASALRANGFDAVKLLTQTQDFDTIRAYPEFLNAIKERMSGGMTLKDALETRFSGEFNCFNGKTVGQKKLHLTGLVQQTLTFDVAQPGVLIGATAEDRAMGTDGKGLTRAVLEVLIDGFVHLVYGEYEAVTAKDILGILEEGAFDEYLEQGQHGKDLGLPDIRSALKSMGRSNAHRPAVVLKTSGPKFYLNSEGVDRLPGRGTDHRPHHQPTQLTESQIVELMRKLTDGANHGSALLKLSGIPSHGAGWQDKAYKHLAKLVHPNKWQRHGGQLVSLATKAFQAVQNAKHQSSGQASTFVPDETDAEAVAAQREAAAAAAADDDPVYMGGLSDDATNSSATAASSSADTVFRSLGSAPGFPTLPTPTPGVTCGASFNSKRALHLQRAQRVFQDSHAYEAALRASQEPPDNDSTDD